MRSIIEKIRSVYTRYERWLMPGVLLSGVIIDILTFRALEIKTTLSLLAAYMATAAICILYTNIYDGISPTPQSRIWQFLRIFAPLVIQFVFGGLLSMSLLFYWYSGSLSVSWPILLFMAFLMASNEVFRHFILRPTVQLITFSFILFSYLSIVIPHLFETLDSWTFIVAGLVSLFITTAIVLTLTRYAPQTYAKRHRMIFGCLMVFAVMNTLYFFNKLPPIPLAIREAGIYLDIKRANGDYELTSEEESFFERLIPGQTIHRKPSGRVYAYTAIFAPTKLSTTIYHRWEFYDQEKNTWKTRDRLSFPLVGGRSGGFRGYTYKTNLTSGKWRVKVETERGQVLGNIPFKLEPISKIIFRPFWRRFGLQQFQD